MRGEFDLFGVYLPPLLPAAILAWALSALAIRLLNRAGAYRVIWHRPLFNLALYVAMLAGVVFGLAAVAPA